MFKLWTEIDLDHPKTMPPLRETILLYSALSRARGWHFLQHQGHRAAVMQRYGYTHFREEMTVDSP